MKEIIVTTFNIRCFGFNGDYFAPKPSESRIPFLKKFLEDNYSKTNVFIFQEIMDHSFLSQILPEGFKTYQYTHTYPRHMHVVLACKPELDFNHTMMIPKTAIDETKSRPAFYGQLEKEGHPLAHVIGVHLKSGYEHTDKRIKQAQSILDFLNTLDADLPTIITGDFNSHIKSKTGKPKDDSFYISEIFRQKSLKRAKQYKPTYATNFEEAFLDHIWTDATVTNVGVYDFNLYSFSNPLKIFFDQISDHLPVTAHLSLK